MKANILCLVSQSLLNRKSERIPCPDLSGPQGSSIAPIWAAERQEGDICPIMRPGFS